ncbi:hypothetical protein CKN86_02280 [Carnobacterium divergens]|uniref:hypothetical protein n=1 Tax=Carnobacterium divergens TaxID=2748 RepID=UPI000D4427C9|nr:hypothetical protein [Carnobacterium divergens]MCO6018258.1 hypothetical protein [Carnobacterium divergens]TFI64615.1 hypothetical protein CKN62_02280 [Carnobacterium divergens]TFI91484.1 hypothetical protein CKN84_02280 [Carnobacterium divergens]TFJ06540.1 hypothetical protein CKN86_02280 [Carnobacterium divergens]TFJ07893.1 hypothetical protein CKN65_02285 [Carnobacterium divergens]
MDREQFKESIICQVPEIPNKEKFIKVISDIHIYLSDLSDEMKEEKKGSEEIFTISSTGDGKKVSARTLKDEIQFIYHEDSNEISIISQNDELDSLTYLEDDILINKKGDKFSLDNIINYLEKLI